MALLTNISLIIGLTIIVLIVVIFIWIAANVIDLEFNVSQRARVWYKERRNKVLFLFPSPYNGYVLVKRFEVITLDENYQGQIRLEINDLSMLEHYMYPAAYSICTNIHKFQKNKLLRIIYRTSLNGNG